MSVVYDLLGFQSRYHGERGIARFVLQLALGLERVRPGLVSQYLIHPELPFPAGAEALVATGRVVRTDQEHHLRRPSEAGVFLAGSPFESFHLPSEHVLPSFARSSRWRTAAVLHDLVPLRYPDVYLSRTVERYAFEARFTAVSGFDHLLVNSLATAAEAAQLLHHGPDRITVIGGGADDRFQRAARPPEHLAAELAADGAVPGLRPGYILLPSGIDPRKNLEPAIRAFGRVAAPLRRAHQLVLMCDLSDRDRRIVGTWVERAGIGDDFLATGYVSDDLLCRLYQAAHVVVFPSLYEGFGLPALEAMQCGAPVICGDSSALKEVQPLPEARFDPRDVDAITRSVEHVLTDHEFRDRLRRQPLPPFTWDNAARLTAGVVDDLVAPERVVVRAPSRPRIAFLGPSLAGDSPVARYLRGLVDELRHRCDVAVFTPGDEPLAGPDGIRVHPAGQLDAVERGGGAFDQVLHLLADDPGCVESFRSLRRRQRGWALFFDIHLTGLYGRVADLHPEEVDADSVGCLLTRLYPHRYKPAIEQLDRIDRATAEQSGIVAAREVASAAELMLVHSHFEATLLALDTGLQPEVLFPLPCPEPHVAFYRPSQAPVVASFGPSAAGRRLDDLVRIMPRVRRAVPDARLRLVGPLAPARAAELQKLAAHEGVGRALDLIGDLAPAELVAARQEATVAVQLDTSSWTPTDTVGRLLASGVPTLVTDLGPASDLPDDAVVKLPPIGTIDRLAAEVTGLLLEPGDREALSEAGLRYAKATSFANAAAAIHERLVR